MTKRRKPIKNITRYTYDYADFEGWRLAICRYHVNYVRYFADKEYGGESASLAAAMTEREKNFSRLEEFPNEPGKVLEEFRAQKPTGSRRGRRGRSRITRKGQQRKSARKDEN